MIPLELRLRGSDTGSQNAPNSSSKVRPRPSLQLTRLADGCCVQVARMLALAAGCAHSLNLSNSCPQVSNGLCNCSRGRAWAKAREHGGKTASESDEVRCGPTATTASHAIFRLPDWSKAVLSTPIGLCLGQQFSCRGLRLNAVVARKLYCLTLHGRAVTAESAGNGLRATAVAPASGTHSTLPPHPCGHATATTATACRSEARAASPRAAASAPPAPRASRPRRCSQRAGPG